MLIVSQNLTNYDLNRTYLDQYNAFIKKKVRKVSKVSKVTKVKLQNYFI